MTRFNVERISCPQSVNKGRCRDLHPAVATIVQVVGPLLNGLAVQLGLPLKVGLVNLFAPGTRFTEGVEPNSSRSNEVIAHLWTSFAAPCCKRVQPRLRQSRIENP